MQFCLSSISRIHTGIAFIPNSAEHTHILSFRQRTFMGFIQRPDLLVQDTAPQVARLLKADGVDAVVLTAT